jgi:hypothetical protein
VLRNKTMNDGMSDEPKRRSRKWYWLSLVVGIASWAAWKFSRVLGFPASVALVGVAVFFALNLTFAFRVARRIR